MLTSTNNHFNLHQQKKLECRIDHQLWKSIQPIVSNTSWLNAYTNNNTTKRTSTFDRKIDPKRKSTTPTKIHFQTTKQDSLKSFGLREKIQTKANQLPQQPTDNTAQSKIQNLTPFDTNESKGDTLNILNPNHIRIFYMNINELELGKRGHWLLQLCLTLKEKGVDMVCFTEKNAHWERAHVYHQFRQTLKVAWPKNKISFCTSESNIKWNSDYAN